MTDIYQHTKETLTQVELERRVRALSRDMCLGDYNELGQAVLSSLAGSVQLVNTLERAGVDLEKVYEVEQWMYFDKAADAKRFAKHVNKKHPGFRADVEARTKEYRPVKVVGRSELQLVTVGRFRLDLCVAAVLYEGWYGNIEVTLTKAESPRIEEVRGAPMTAEHLDGLYISHRPGFEVSPENAQATRH